MNKIKKNQIYCNIQKSILKDFCKSINEDHSNNYFLNYQFFDSEYSIIRIEAPGAWDKDTYNIVLTDTDGTRISFPVKNDYEKEFSFPKDDPDAYFVIVDEYTIFVLNKNLRKALS